MECSSCKQSSPIVKFTQGRAKCNVCRGKDAKVRRGLVAKPEQDRRCVSCKQVLSLDKFELKKISCIKCSNTHCDKCNKDYADTHAYKKHINDVHLKLKNYKCEYCEFACSQKSSLKVHSCYALKAKRENPERATVKGAEAEVQAKMEKETGGSMQRCPVGTADIVTEDEIIEIKHWHYWKTALGQIIAYGHYYPNLAKRIHFFGAHPPDEYMDKITKICNAQEIEVTYEE